MVFIIGLCGLIGSGKDTTAGMLEELATKDGGGRCCKISFAGILKDVVSMLFRWDRQLLEGDTVESRTFRDTVDDWWSTRLNMPGLTPRKVLQLFGTDVMRTHFHPDIWVVSLEKTVESLVKQGTSVIVSDCRFPNEVAAVKKLGGFVVRIQRSDVLPEWHTTALEALKGDQESIHKMHHHYQVHPSEYTQLGFKVDYQLENTGSVDELKNKVQAMVQALKLNIVFLRVSNFKRFSSITQAYKNGQTNNENNQYIYHQ